MTFSNIARLSMPKTAFRSLIPLAVLTVLSLAGAALIHTVWLNPAQQQLMTAEQAYQAAKQAHAGLQGSRIQQTQARAAQQQLDLAKEALLSQEEFTSLAMALMELGKTEHVSIPGMGYDIKKAEGTHPTKATITFQATGDYAAVYRFIHRVETVDPYVVIESLDVASEHARKESVSGRVVVHIHVATYLRQGPPPARSS
ncbi:MAG: type 4a pilus biogenesis protein PilO [Nitrospira sp.]